jgi:hypothetical protein
MLTGHQIMDPKMDSGVIMPGESVELTFDPTAPLTAAQTLWILDQLSCLEIAWLEGHPLSQTVFTSLHLDRLLSPDNRYPYNLLYGGQADLSTNNACLTHVVIKAYCVALTKCCAQVLVTVQSQNFYDEEDFVTHLFGQELLPRMSEDDVKIMLDDAIRWVVNSNLDQKIKHALEVRLQGRKLYMLSTFGQENLWAALVGFTEENMTEESHALAEGVPDAFTDKVQRHLATSTPPRPMLELTWADSQRKWVKLFSDINEADRLTDSWTRQSPACLQKAVWYFASRTPGTYPRAIFQDLLFAGGTVRDDVSHFDLMLLDIRDLVLAGDVLVDSHSFQVEVPSDPRHRCSRVIETFMDKAWEEYLNLYRMICQNRCRIRRTFTQAIPLLHELETTIALEADRDIDVVMPQKRLDTSFGDQVQLSPLTSWSRWHKLQIMTETISLGFETDIYLDYEMGGMYWYLAQLNVEKRKLLQHIETFLVDRMSGLANSRNVRSSADCFAMQDWMHCLYVETEISILLSEALSELYVLLSHTGLLKSAKRPFAQPQLVHEARLKPFAAVTDPPFPSLKSFEAAQTLSTSLSEAVTRIEARVSPIKAHLTKLKTFSPQAGKYVGTETHWKAQITRLETTSVAIFVGTSVLKRTLKKGTDGGDEDRLQGKLEVRVPAMGKRYHDWWVVPQIKLVKV